MCSSPEYVLTFFMVYELYAWICHNLLPLSNLQHQEAQAANGNKYLSFEYKSGMDNGGKSSSSDRDSQ